MIHIIYGPDDFSSREYLAEIKKGLGEPDTLATNTTCLEGGKLTLAELRAAAEALPFFGEKRLVIVSGLLRRFEPKRKPAPRSKAPRETKAEDALAFASLMKGLPPSTVLVLVDTELESKDPLKTNPLLIQIAASAEVRAFPPLRTAELKSWVKERVASLGGEISEAALAQLIRLVGPDLWVMSGEVAKLASYAAGRRIEEADVEALVSQSREASIFGLVDAAIDAQPAAAQGLLSELLRSGITPSHILTMLGRQLRFLVLAREMLGQGRPAPSVQARLGLAPYAASRTIEQAGRYSPARLNKLYHRLLDTDVTIKLGIYSDELALSILVAELCQSRHESS